MPFLPYRTGEELNYKSDKECFGKNLYFINHVQSPILRRIETLRKFLGLYVVYIRLE